MPAPLPVRVRACAQEAWEAGGLLSPEEAVAALPCLRLLVDRKLLGNLRFCMLLMVQIRNRIPAHVLDDAEERTDVRRLGGDGQGLGELGVRAAKSRAFTDLGCAVVICARVVAPCVRMRAPPC